MTDTRGPRRVFSTATLAARLGWSALSRQWGRTPPSSDEAVVRALALVEQLDGMKGLLLKCGQMASYLDAGMPPEARQILARLQSHAAAQPWSQVKPVLERALGKPASELFDAMEPVALAAGSIGQVHRAVYRGQPVAVKIQYPGIRDLIETDLATVGGLVRVMLGMSAMDGPGLAEELAARLREECDFALEARRQSVIAAVWAARDDVHVPGVIPACSSSHVLTSEWVDALEFQPFRDTASASSRDRAGMTLFSTVFEGIFRHGFFNGDPHPGNYLFDQSGRVTLLDFGCVKVFPDAMLYHWKCMALSILDGQPDRFREAVTALGMVGRSRHFDWDFQWQLMRHIYSPFRSVTPFTYTRAYTAESNRLLLWNNANRRHAAMPPDFLFVNRLQWGLSALLADLQVTGVFRDVFRAAVEAPIQRPSGM